MTQNVMFLIAQLGLGAINAYVTVQAYRHGFRVMAAAGALLVLLALVLASYTATHLA